MGQILRIMPSKKVKYRRYLPVDLDKKPESEEQEACPGFMAGQCSAEPQGGLPAAHGNGGAQGGCCLLRDPGVIPWCQAPTWPTLWTCLIQEGHEHPPSVTILSRLPLEIKPKEWQNHSGPSPKYTLQGGTYTSVTAKCVRKSWKIQGRGIAPCYDPREATVPSLQWGGIIWLSSGPFVETK